MPKLEYIKSRLDNTIVSEIKSKQSFSSLLIDTSISKNDLIFKDVKFGALEINNSTFKKNLSFINCNFKHGISLKNINCGGSITFINCDIQGDFNAFKLNITSNTFGIVQSRVYGAIILEAINTKHLDIDNTLATKITISSRENKSSIEQITIQSTSIDISLRLMNVDNIKNLKISNTLVPLLLIKHLDLIEKASFIMDSCKTDDFNFELSNLKKDSFFIIDKCTSTNLGLSNNKYYECQVQIQDSLIRGILSITGCSQIQSYFDFSTSNLANLNLDSSLTNFISQKKQHIPLFSIQGGSPQKIGTLKILKTAFADNHEYELEDKTFYLLKNEEAKFNIKNQPMILKIPKYTSYFVNRFILGWGVKISNPIFAFVFFAIIGIIYNYLTLDLHNSLNNIEYVGENLTGLNAAIILTLLSLFGQQADATLTGVIPSYVFMSEFILGLIMITLIIGILIRKLVR